MRVYFSDTKPDGIGGGWTALRNLKKGLGQKVQFANSVEDCDIFFINGVTMVDKDLVYKARDLKKKIVLRVDNVPRKSRNKRSTPHERLREFAQMADAVIYQSEWAKEYCYPLCGDGTVIYNGVDTSIFKPDPSVKNINRYLYIYHGKNEHKNFWEAHLRFQYEFRKNRDAEFWFVYDFREDEEALRNGNFDFWQGEKYLHLQQLTSPEEVAEIMQQCGKLIYPAICDAAPNVVTEGLACGLEVCFAAPKELAGTQEIIDDHKLNGPRSIEDMANDYYGIFQVVML